MLVQYVCVVIILIGSAFIVIAQNRYDERCTFIDCSVKWQFRIPSNSEDTHRRSLVPLSFPGGVLSSENQYSWLASIEHEYDYEPKIKIHCTGALVSDKHVISNALCFDRNVFSGIAKSVRLGLFNAVTTGGNGDNTYKENGTLKVPIESVTIDPDYSSPNWADANNIQHDVAIITLRDAVPYTDFIRPICLPRIDIIQPDVTDSKLYLAGVSDKDRNNYKIQQAAFTYMDKGDCKNVLKNEGVPVVEDNFCATLNEDIDPCEVNSFVNGGVLMNKRKDSYELVGLGIFEPSCMAKSVSRIRVFTHLFLYRNWIRSKTIEWKCGKQPTEDRFAWLAVIEFQYRDEPREAKCSGALISRRHVVCNAECFHMSAIPGMVRTVRLGLHNTIEGRNCTGQDGSKNCTDEIATRIPIKAVITHPEFTRSFKESGIHDIALAILSEMVKYSDFIRPICFPSVDVTQLPESDRELYVNEFYYKGPLSDIKRRSSMTYVDKEGCREVLNNYDMILPEDLMCAKQTEAVDPNWCLYPGDLLVNKIGDTYELVGLTQLSYCGATKVFTNVYRSLDWLRSIIPEWTHGCGRRKVEHVELIFSGETTKPGDWPWHAAIYRFKKHGYHYTCGGTLISKKMVLTAAHCAVAHGVPINPELLKVFLGKYNLDIMDLQSQERYVQSVIVHEAFAPTQVLNNDIALLKLAIDASYSDYVQPACIWSNDVFDNLPSDKNLGTVGDWLGFDESIRISPRLKQTSLPMIPELTCIEKNPTFYVKALDNKKKFCAGWANGTSPCNGDSGGGFFTFVPDSAGGDSSNGRGCWYIRGIVSLTPSLRNWAICDPNQYVVFTDITNYTDWIETHLLH